MDDITIEEKIRGLDERIKRFTEMMRYLNSIKDGLIEELIDLERERDAVLSIPERLAMKVDGKNDN